MTQSTKASACLAPLNHPWPVSVLPLILPLLHLLPLLLLLVALLLLLPVPLLLLAPLLLLVQLLLPVALLLLAPALNIRALPARLPATLAPAWPQGTGAPLLILATPMVLMMTRAAMMGG